MARLAANHTQFFPSRLSPRHFPTVACGKQLRFAKEYGHCFCHDAEAKLPNDIARLAFQPLAFFASCTEVFNLFPFFIGELEFTGNLPVGLRKPWIAFNKLSRQISIDTEAFKGIQGIRRFQPLQPNHAGAGDR